MFLKVKIIKYKSSKIQVTNYCVHINQKQLHQASDLTHTVTCSLPPNPNAEKRHNMQPFSIFPSDCLPVRRTAVLERHYINSGILLQCQPDSTKSTKEWGDGNVGERISLAIWGSHNSDGEGSSLQGYITCLEGFCWLDIQQGFRNFPKTPATTSQL